MASLAMTSSFLGGAAAATTKQRPVTAPRAIVMVKASKVTADAGKTVNSKEEKSSSGRRDLVFAAAAAAACSIVQVAAAAEPKRGTPEALKKYGPVCATMPTARICHK